MNRYEQKQTFREWIRIPASRHFLAMIGIGSATMIGILVWTYLLTESERAAALARAEAFSAAAAAETQQSVAELEGAHCKLIAVNVHDLSTFQCGQVRIERSNLVTHAWIEIHGWTGSQP